MDLQKKILRFRFEEAGNHIISTSKMGHGHKKVEQRCVKSLLIFIMRNRKHDYCLYVAKYHEL